MEEASGSTESDYGVLECAWTDALVDDVDTERMAELSGRAVEKATEMRGVKRHSGGSLDPSLRGLLCLMLNLPPLRRQGSVKCSSRNVNRSRVFLREHKSVKWMPLSFVHL